MNAQEVADAEVALWPHLPGIAKEEGASSLIAQLRERLEQTPIEEFCSIGDLGRALGADMRLSPLPSPRRGWTWFHARRPVIEVADWLPSDLQVLVAAHEISHLLLGPLPVQHDPLTERVCNWGASQILGRLPAP